MNRNVQIAPFLYAEPAPRFRRFAALIYDGFIVFSWLLLATALALFVNKGQSLLPYRMLFLSYLFVSTGLFLSFFWTKGQTLGMLAWKIKVTTTTNSSLSLKKAFIRYVVAFIGTACGLIGFLWCFFDKDKQSLHDRISKTRMVIAPSLKTATPLTKKASLASTPLK